MSLQSSCPFDYFIILCLLSVSYFEHIEVMIKQMENNITLVMIIWHSDYDSGDENV